MKDKDKSFVGQPVLSQILDLIPSSLINRASRKHQANRYYKKIPLRAHLVSLLFGVFSYCNGLRELCEGLLACEGKLVHYLCKQAFTGHRLLQWTRGQLRPMSMRYLQVVKEHIYILGTVADINTQISALSYRQICLDMNLEIIPLFHMLKPGP